MDILIELIKFVLSRRKFWLYPALIVISLFGMIIIYVQGSVFAPLIYTVF